MRHIVFCRVRVFRSVTAKVGNRIGNGIRLYENGCVLGNRIVEVIFLRHGVIGVELPAIAFCRYRFFRLVARLYHNRIRIISLKVHRKVHLRIKLGFARQVIRMVRVVTILIIHHQFAVADIPRNLEIRRIGAGIGIVKVIVDNLIVPQYIQADIIIAGCILWLCALTYRG